jgi:K+-sensing histidine kinase KdpD
MPGSDLPERNLPLTGGADSAAAVRDAPRTVWRSAPMRYGAAVLAIVAVAVIQHFAVPQQDLAPFVLFFAGIALASVYGGRGPGLLAALLAAATGNYFFIRPFGQFTLHGSALIATTLSLVSGVFVAVFCGSPA